MVETSESIVDKELFFSREEYRGRLASVRLHMEQRGVDALLVHTPENILYLSGYQTPGYYAYQCLVIVHQHDPVLLIRDTEKGNAYAYSWLSDHVGYYDSDSHSEVTSKVLAGMGIRNATVGVEMSSWFLTARVYEDLRERNPHLRWADASGTVEKSRARKSPLEPGMVFHLPLSVRIYGRYGASFSETVAVTETGHEVLTNFERELFVKYSRIDTAGFEP